MNPASKITAIDQVPALHKFFVKSWGTQHRVFDFGAGKMGKVDEFMRGNTSGYFPYDPFNRDGMSNQFSLDSIEECNFILCANVLNVLEEETLDKTIKELADLTRQTLSGFCYISVYHKSSLPKNRQVGNHFQRNELAKWYIPHLKMHFDTVYLAKGILRCFA